MSDDQPATIEDLEAIASRIVLVVAMAASVVIISLGFAVSALGQTPTEKMGALALYVVGLLLYLIYPAVVYNGKSRWLVSRVPTINFSKRPLSERTYSNGELVISDD